MPEGDSVATDAARLRPVLVGERIQSVDGTAPSVRANSHRLLDAKVGAIRTFGKNLVVDLDNDYSVRVHLGMPGRWRVLLSGGSPPGSARLVLTTLRHHAVCLAAPTVEVDRTPRIDLEMQRLGPDVLDDAFEPDLFIERARTRNDLPIAEVLLDQRVMAGLGNVYKSELLFLASVHPETPVEAVRDETLGDIAVRAGKLLQVNVGPGRRITTGRQGRGREVWVYERAGKPCRRCATAIEKSRLGDRVTFWCPACQVRGL